MGKETAIRAHGITTKLLPFVFQLIVFLYVLEYTTTSFSVISPEDMFMGISLIVAGGLIFLYEAFESKSESARFSTAWVIMLFLSMASMVYGFLVLFYIYQPVGDTGLDNFILVVILSASLLILGAGSITEIVLSTRMRLHKVLP